MDEWSHPHLFSRRPALPKTRAMPRMVMLVLALVLAAPATARAATRYAAPGGSTTSAGCEAADPCTLERAVNGASPGDEVVVGPGAYHLTTALKPRGALDLHGDADYAAPEVSAAASLSATPLTFRAGTLSHLALSAGGKQTALSLLGGTADGVRVASAAGIGAVVAASRSGTVLRNSVVTGAATAAKLSGKGDVALRNVTAMAARSDSEGIDADVDGSATLVNVLVRGGKTDIKGHKGTAAAAFSNFRPERTSGLQDGAGNQSEEPLFADADYRPAEGSPTIDAGALDALAASADPDGRPRRLGSAPDIGAYEFVPAAAAAPAGDDGSEAPGSETQMPAELRGVPAPEQGRSVVVAAARGTVRVRRPGEPRFVPLATAGRRIPVGSVLDARRGRVQLVSAVGRQGAVQAGVFWGSRFRATQGRHGGGMTTLTLRGPELRACGRAGGRIALASKKRRRSRSLWGRDHHGRFRTHGHDSVATARGTAWLTRETCAGTRTRVIEGAVSVRDLRRHRRVLVKAGHSYLARRHAR
jgi:hypothetical protein